MRTAALFLLLALPGGRAQEEPYVLKMKYAEGDSEVLGITLRMKMEIDVRSETTDYHQITEGPLNLTMRMRCRGSRDGKSEFRCLFRDLRLDQNLSVTGLQFRLTVRDRTVRMTDAGGKVIVDSEQGINPEKAREILEAFGPLGQEFDLTMDDRGLVPDLRKKTELRKLFPGGAGDNLLPVVLPEKAVRVGEEWVYTGTMHEIGDIQIPGEALKIPITYRLERVEGREDDRVAVITMKQNVELKNVEGSGRIEGTGEARILISSLTSTGEGTTRFHLGRGRILDSRFEAKVATAMRIQPEDMAEMSTTVHLGMKGRMTPRREF